MMTQTVNCRSTLLLALFFLLLTAGASAAHQGSTLRQTNEYLLDYVSASGLTYKRNGSSYTAAEAADHMRRKYEHFQDDIQSPEEFIRLCATRSLLSGKPYTLVDEDGRELATADWLTSVLLEYRRNTAASEP